MEGEKNPEKEWHDNLAYLIAMAKESQSDFSTTTPQEILKNIFGFNGFKPNQEEIITRILKKEGDTLAVMPTGGGKSLCFQIPALLLTGLTLVVSPLIALMKDQIDSLHKKGIYSAFFINSLLPDDVKETVFELLLEKKIKLLYISPESLKSEKILQVLKEAKVNLFVIDEAHCISSWGHDFRPDYLNLSGILDQLGNPLVLALTATATKEVMEDIQKQLRIQCKVFKSSFDRPLLYLHITQLPDNADKDLFLLHLLKKLKGPTIIYVTLQKTAENLAEYLSSNGHPCIYYHGGIHNRNDREERQNAFISGSCDIIVSTIAFGMGIDKPNIRNIIHYNVSQSIENYYQEIGRAGRDGKGATCITLFSKIDVERIRQLKKEDWPTEEKVRDIISFLKNKGGCTFTSPRSMQYELDIKEIPIRLMLQRLEEEGAIKIYSRIPVQVLIDKPLSHSHSEILEKSGPYAEHVRKILSSDFFTNKRKKWLSYEELMETTHLTYFKIKEVMAFLKKHQHITIKNEIIKDLIVNNEKLNSFNSAPMALLFEGILRNNLIKLDTLTRTILCRSCIRIELLSYFGETYPHSECGQCSSCLGDNLTAGITPTIDENYATEKELDSLTIAVNKSETTEIKLLKCLALDKSIPKKSGAKIFAGKINARHGARLFTLKSHNMLPSFQNKPDELDAVIESMITHKLIAELTDGTLRITRKGIVKIILGKI